MQKNCMQFYGCYSHNLRQLTQQHKRQILHWPTMSIGKSQNKTIQPLYCTLFGKAVLKGVSDTFLFRPSTRGNYLIIMPMLLVAVSNIKRRHSIILNSAWVVFILLICVPPILQNPILLLAPPIVMKLDYSTYKILRKPIIWIS